MMISVRSVGLIALAAFLLHGQLSAAIPAITPLQLPLAALATLCAFLGLLPLRKSVLSATALFLLAVLAIYVAPPVMVVTDYSDAKPRNMLLVLGFTLLLPPLLIRNRPHLAFMLNSLGVIASGVVLLALPTLAQRGLGARLTLGEEGNPIWLGRAAGLAALWVAWRLLNGRMRLLPGGALLLASFAVVFATGSRGPLLAMIVGLIALTLSTLRQIRVRHVLISGMALLLGITGYQVMPSQIGNVFNRGEDLTAGREGLLQIAWSFIQTTPRGLGVGGFDAWAGPRYPHNLIAEVTVELGWLAGGALTLGLLVVLLRYLSVARLTPVLALALAVYVYSLLNTMFSGDALSPKELYLLVSVSLIGGVFSGLRNQSPQVRSTGRPDRDVASHAAD